MIQIKLKNGQYVQFVTDEQLILTDNPDEAATFSWSGSIKAQELIQKHLNNPDLIIF